MESTPVVAVRGSPVAWLPCAAWHATKGLTLRLLCTGRVRPVVAAFLPLLATPGWAPRCCTCILLPAPIESYMVYMCISPLLVAVECLCKRNMPVDEAGLQLAARAMKQFSLAPKARNYGSAVLLTDSEV
jgi:hypothetical protein